MEQADKQFMRHFAGILAILVAFTVAMLILSTFLMSVTMEDPGMAPEAVAERIEPVGEVNVGEVPAAQQQAASSEQAASASAGGGEQQAASGQAASAEQVYNNVCAACHANGTAGAPVYGNKGEWTARLEQGKETLYQAALNGKGAMPAKGGQSDLSKKQVKAAVDYMLEAVQ